MMYEMNGKMMESAFDLDEVKRITSVHGLIRTMERTERSDRQALRFIQNAWTRGKSMEQLETKWQKRFLAIRNSLLSDGYTNLRVYSGFLFIFSASGRLITMYPLPRSFTHKRVFDGKTLVRDARKYSRLNGCREAAKEMEELALLCG